MKTHKLEDCFFEGGGKAGQFPPHWKRNNFKKKKLGKIGQIGFCDTDEIVIDSGATNHTTNDLNSLYDIEHTSFEAHMPNGTIIEATIKGKLDLILQGDSIGTITDVYYSERFMGTLVSYNQLDNCGCSIYPSPGKLHIKSPQGKVIITAKKRDGLFVTKVRKIKPETRKKVILFNKKSETCSMEMMHRRMGHANMEAIKKVPSQTKDGNYTGNSPAICDVCVIANSHTLPYSQKNDEPRNGIGRLDFDV